MLTYRVSSISQPMIILRRENPLYAAEVVHEVSNPGSPETNVWHLITVINSFSNGFAGKYIFETKFNGDVVQSRELTFNVQGNKRVSVRVTEQQTLMIIIIY